MSKDFNYPLNTICLDCGIVLTKDNWCQKTRRCRLCNNAKGRQYYQDNRDRLLSKMRERDPEGRWEYNIKRWYGITADQYYEMLSTQDNGCAICGSKTPGGKRLKKFHIDHCHQTGKVRGVLCGICNLVIGAVNEDPARLESAANYLKANK